MYCIHGTAYCRENGAVPLNFATLVRNSALLAPPQDRFDKCRLDANSPPESIFACLDQLGIKGYRLHQISFFGCMTCWQRPCHWNDRFQGSLTAWDCPDPNAVEQCGGLACARKYVGDIRYECRMAINDPGAEEIRVVLPGNNGQGYYIPVGCE